MDDLIKEAEQKLVNICRSFEDIQSIFGAMSRFADLYLTNESDRTQFYNGMQMVRNAVQTGHLRAESRLFVFAGVGGKEAEEYSREQFENYFKDDSRMVMHFLDTFGRVPSSWQSDKEEEFKKQAREKINE